MQNNAIHALAKLVNRALSKVQTGSSSQDRAAHDSVERAPDGLPIPSEPLIKLVAGPRAGISWFLEGGRRGAESIVEILERNGARFADLRAILDFGCGCGRVIRHFSSAAGTKFYGADYNPEMVAWCERHLPFAKFTSNGLGPPLPFPSKKFDLVYALSVFTHLSEELQFRWMEDLSRVLKPGGFLLLTTHGESYLGHFSDEEKQQFRSGKLITRGVANSGTNTCSAFHPPAYVRAELAKDFQVLDFIPEGAKGNPTQDAYLLRKPPLSTRLMTVGSNAYKSY